MKIILTLIIICLLSGCKPPASVVSGNLKPNIIIILIDDAGYEDFGFMGTKDLLTPEIDKLAESGTIFTDAHTSSTVCSPSRAGLMTGRYQQRFGFECNGTGNNSGLDTSESTIADALKSEGYKTIAIGKWHLGDQEKYKPNNRGFDEFYGFLSGSRSYFFNPEIDNPNHISALRHNNEQVKFDGYLTDVFGDVAVDYIEKYKNEKFFMYLSFNAVHTPLQAKEKDLEKFKKNPRQMLAAMTWSLDENIGKVIKKLENEHLIENTLIFFLSDNGGATNNQSSVYPLKGWKGNEFEGGHRVPFVVSWKGHLPERAKNNKLTSSLDIFSTSLAVAGINPKLQRPLDGVNLIPFLNQSNKEAPHQMLFWRKDIDAAARFGDYKLVRLRDYGSVLYDLKNNISETIDLTTSNQEKSIQLNNSLKEWEKQMNAPLWTEDDDWTNITFDIHKALMNNKIPDKIHP